MTPPELGFGWPYLLTVWLLLLLLWVVGAWRCGR